MISRDAERDEQAVSEISPDVVILSGQEMGQKKDQGDLDHFGNLEGEHLRGSASGWHRRLGFPDGEQKARRGDITEITNAGIGQLSELMVRNPCHQNHEPKARRRGRRAVS